MLITDVPTRTGSMPQLREAAYQTGPRSSCSFIRRAIRVAVSGERYSVVLTQISRKRGDWKLSFQARWAPGAGPHPSTGEPGVPRDPPLRLYECSCLPKQTPEFAERFGHRIPPDIVYENDHHGS